VGDDGFAQIDQKIVVRRIRAVSPEMAFAAEPCVRRSSFLADLYASQSRRRRIAIPAVVLSGVHRLASAQVTRQRLKGRSATLLATTALVAVTVFAPGTVGAQDATWLFSPTSNNFNTEANWMPATVPTGTAFFGTSNTTALAISIGGAAGGWTFKVGASAHTFANSQKYSFTGAGIVINGGSASIINDDDLSFLGTSTAGCVYRKPQPY
jgi:hypothetical protein